MPTYKLTYFNARGRAEVSRFLFILAGIEYEDVRVEMSEWESVKDKTLYGQLPLLEVDGETICQSHSIERYLARKFGLLGNTEWEQARADMIIECMDDYMKPLLPLFFDISDGEKNDIRKKYREEQVPPFLNNLEKILKENKDWKSGHFIGSEITVADVIFFDITNNGSFFTGETIPESWDQWPGLKAVREAVADQPKLKDWIAKRPDSSF